MIKASLLFATLCLVLLAIGFHFVLEHVDEEDLVHFSDLPQDVQSWRQRGKMVQVFEHEMFVIDVSASSDGGGAVSEESENDAIIFFHGFPTSSFDYHRALKFLQSQFGKEEKKRRLVFFDHVGFGFSDKPKVDYEFTIHDHAENALNLMQILNIKSGHIIAHDMGDSVLTEILTRRHLGLLPSQFDNFFKSVTFTNGGMRYDLINFRITQRLLTLPVVGPALAKLNSKLPGHLAKAINRQQLSSIYGPQADKVHKEQDIEAIFLLMRHNGGSWLVHKTVSYLKDRARFESRWYRALRQLDIPCMLLWGDSDAVAPMDIAKFLARHVIPPENLRGKYLKDVGHFLMLERPEDWSKLVSQFVADVEKQSSKN